MLDKYYTQPEIARECAAFLERFLSPDTLLIEPSAGAGAFVDATKRAVFAYDVAPDHPEIVAHDFLTEKLAPVFCEIGDVAMLGNPPFGNRSLMAVAFLNRALDVAHTVGFILPLSFRRWDTQRKVRPGARLVLDYGLPEDAFTLAGDPYRLPCTFQVWTLNDRHPDHRLRQAPANSHPHFEIKQYCPDSPATARHFASQWDFAVSFQGFHTYGRIYDPAQCDPRRHWMMFRAASDKALRRLLRIDFAALSRTRPVVPGFDRSDVVATYVRTLEQ